MNNTFNTGEAMGVRSYLKLQNTCEWADNLGFIREGQRRFRVIPYWAAIFYNKFRGKSGSVDHKPAMKSFWNIELRAYLNCVDEDQEVVIDNQYVVLLWIIWVCLRIRCPIYSIGVLVHCFYVSLVCCHRNFWHSVYCGMVLFRQIWNCHQYQRE